jgi:hypothetical protein
MSKADDNDVFLKQDKEKEVDIHDKIETVTENEQDEYKTSQFKMLRLINDALSQKISRYDEYDTTVNSSDDESEYDDDDNMSLISYDSLDLSFDEV